MVEFQVYALTGGLASLMPLKDVAQLKRRAQALRKDERSVKVSYTLPTSDVRI